MPDIIPSNYYDILAQIESGGNPNAKSPSSSASGEFQLTKATAISLGLPWGTDPSQPFGGASVSLDAQLAAIQDLTQRNAVGLSNNGIPINNASLYAAHFLGVGGATQVLSSDPSSSLSSILPASVLNANPFLKGMNVGDFNSWLGSKTGTDPTTGQGVPGSSSGNPFRKLHRQRS
jgi:hypothetical protein